MRRTARILALLLAAAMLAAAMAACTSAAPTAAPQTDAPKTEAPATEAPATEAATEAPADPMGKYDPGITLTLAGVEKDPNENFPEGMDAENNPWRTAYQEELGITFENKWTVPGDQFNEKLNTQIAAGDIPDIMNGLGAGPKAQLIKLGLATPLEDLIEQYATDLCKQGLNSDGGYSLLYCMGEDGHTYALPHVYGYTDNVNMMWVRTDWLKKVNLTAPKTLDEFYEMLKAFSAADFNGDGKADGTIGLSTEQNLWEVQCIFNACGAQPFWSWYKDTDGKLRYSTVYNPEGSKKALEFLNKLYKEGLMDQEFGTADGEKFNEDISSGKVGVCFREWWFADTLQNTVTNDPNADWEAYPIPTGMDTVARPFAYYGPAAYNVVSIKCEQPEAIVKLLNLYVDKVYGPKASEYFGTYMLSPNGYEMKFQGLIGLAWANKVDAFQHVADAVDAKDPSKLNGEEKTYYDNCMKFVDGDRSQWAAYRKYGPKNAMVTVVDYYSKNATPLFSNYYGASTESVQQYQGSLDAKWLSTCVEIIMGSKPVSAFDDFVTEWYSLGGDKMEKEINDYAAAHPDIVK